MSCNLCGSGEHEQSFHYEPEPDTSAPAKGEQKTLKQAAVEVLADLNAMSDADFQARIERQEGELFREQVKFCNQLPCVCGGSCQPDPYCNDCGSGYAADSRGELNCKCPEPSPSEPNYQQVLTDTKISSGGRDDVGETVVKMSRRDLIESLGNEIESLKAQLKIQTDANLLLEEQLDQFESANARLRGALEFYASVNNWAYTTYDVCQMITPDDLSLIPGNSAFGKKTDVGYVYECGGKIAREALKEVGGKP